MVKIAKNTTAGRLRRVPPPAAASSAPKRVPPAPYRDRRTNMKPIRSVRYRKRTAGALRLPTSMQQGCDRSDPRTGKTASRTQDQQRLRNPSTGSIVPIAEVGASGRRSTWPSVRLPSFPGRPPAPDVYLRLGVCRPFRICLPAVLVDDRDRRTADSRLPVCTGDGPVPAV